MATECISDLFRFEAVERREVVAAFGGGAISSDAGALLLGATDRAIAMMDRFAKCFHDERRLIEHKVVTLVGQRVFGIALGYEDLNDHDELRHDPLIAVLSGKLEARRKECAPVAGKSTLNRLELSRLEPTRYHKISHNPTAWRMAYRRWLSSVAFEHPAQQIVFQDYVDAVGDAERRLKRVEGQILALLSDWSLSPIVDDLQAMRGIAVINAVVLVAEVGDFTRFTNPRQLMAYFGLVPGERSSGQSVHRVGITKTGNARARRALVEGAWSYRMKARVGRHKVDRIEALPKVVRDIAWKAQLRLCGRYSPAQSARQDRQRRYCRDRTRDGWLHLVDRLHSAIGREDGLNRQAPKEQERRAENNHYPRRAMRRWGRDNAGEPSQILDMG